MASLVGSDIPDIKVDDSHVDYSYDNQNNQLEVFKKINALLENSLDLSAINNGNNATTINVNSSANIHVPEKGGSMGTQGCSLEQLFGNMHLEQSTPQQQPHPSTHHLPMTVNNSGAQQVPDPYSAALSNFNFTGNAYHLSPEFYSPVVSRHYQQAPYQQDYFNAYQHFRQPQQDFMVTPGHRPQHKTLYNQRHPNDFSQASQAYHQQQADFIQGAISNRTLEQITESFARPYRAIKAEHTSSKSQSGSSTQTTPESKARPEEGLSRLFNRTGSPTDSDTSGIGSECSDTMLLDLMHSLSIAQQGNTTNTITSSNVTPTTTHPPSATALTPSAAHCLPENLLATPVHHTPSNQMDILRALGIPNKEMALLQAITPDHQQLQLQQPLTPQAVPSVDFNNDPKQQMAAVNPLFSTNVGDPYSIERAAKLYRNAASICEATCTWSGQLPPKIYKNPNYSCKVFLGGVPWDITEVGLQAAFKTFGPMKIEWPGRDGKHPRYPPRGNDFNFKYAGYVYVLFDNEKSVRALLQSCTHDFSNGGEYYFRISSRRMRSKEVQVIPWALGDSNYVRQPSQRLDPSKTVFVGALHGMLTAEALASIMNDLFGNVVYAGIDTDKHKYPIGSGRVTFSSHKSYMKAVNAAFVEVKTPKFTKKIQVDPYLEDSLCNVCGVQQGPFFCRDLTCFRYFCRTCWQWTHTFEAARHHKPLMRNNRTTLNPMS